MAKVLRLHAEANNNITDWVGGTNMKYGTNVINQIQDPQGATSKKEITSIPSPFARIDLAKSAFKYVADQQNKIHGDTIYHKIVSDCLDIGEIFFNIDKYAGKVEIIVWDKEKQLSSLVNSKQGGHKILGQTLKMYLDQDKDAYNFANMERLYLLKYIGKDRKTQMDIIGSTSPSTFFFSSANDLSYIKDLKSSGKDIYFDDNYSPLYKRGSEFQKYLYSLRISEGEQSFNNKFPEFSAYLERNYEYMDPSLKDDIGNIANDEKCIEQFPTLNVSQDDIEVLGIKLRKSKNSVSAEVKKSDFRIASNRCTGDLPLVLPVDAGNRYVSLKYIQNNWGTDYHAPFYDNNTLEDRVLPHAQDKYPYLTISDFLTPSIISMPYEMTDSFFNGNLSDRSISYLLPLTKLFFDYFSVDDLVNKKIGGKGMIDIKCNSSAAEVTLRVPIQGNEYITYTRRYFANNQYDAEKNQGRVVEYKFGLGILPLVQAPDVNSFYRVAFFSRNPGSKLSFFFGNSVCDPQDLVQRREPSPEVCGVETYVVNKQFDRILVTIDGTENVIVPKFKRAGRASQFTFAVDFGTTNTHIEYCIDDSKASHSFDIKQIDKQMCRMHKDYKAAKDIKYAFEDAFIPDTIADSDDYSFPIRTVLAEYAAIDYKQQINCMSNGNIPFRYEKAANTDYNKVKTDIKWSNQSAKRVELYLDNLFMLMRNKVLMNLGDLSKTKIIWFYPISMTKARCDTFAKIWKQLYSKYFGEYGSTNLVMMSESVAPYYYYKQKQGAKSNVVTIDIGGGTTDVFVVEENQPKMISSFRFAANSIFGDGYNYTSDTNGFVNSFKGDISSILQSNDHCSGMRDVIDAYHEIENSENSNDIIAFFFSLANNSIIQKNKVPLDFMDMLSKNEKFKYVFIVFYGSILFYVAKMMKARNLRMPQTLAFSGNGSKTVSILSDSKETVSRFATYIFEKVYRQKYENSKLDIIYGDEPKKATCKGGIASNENLDFEQIDEIRTSLLGVDDSTFTDGLKYSDTNTDKSIQSIAKYVSDFIDFLFEINSDNKQFFMNYLGADSSIMSEIKSLCKQDLSEYTKQGVKKKKEELESWGAGNDTDVEETMFFYPFVAMLNNIAQQIYRNQIN